MVRQRMWQSAIIGTLFLCLVTCLSAYTGLGVKAQEASGTGGAATGGATTVDANSAGGAEGETFTGVVFEDVNGNGARDEGETGVSGVSVSNELTTGVTMSYRADLGVAAARATVPGAQAEPTRPDRATPGIADLAVKTSLTQDYAADFTVGIFGWEGTATAAEQSRLERAFGADGTTRDVVTYDADGDGRPDVTTARTGTPTGETSPATYSFDVPVTEANRRQVEAYTDIAFAYPGDTVTVTLGEAQVDRLATRARAGGYLEGVRTDAGREAFVNGIARGHGGGVLPALAELGTASGLTERSAVLADMVPGEVAYTRAEREAALAARIEAREADRRARP